MVSTTLKFNNCHHITSGLKDAAITFYTRVHNQFGQATIDKVSQTISAKQDFLAKSIIKSARIFLIITMAWTILLGLKSISLNLYHSGHWPILTNFQTFVKENHSDSDIFKENGSTKNNYIAKSSKRYNFNILEATKETLCTINVQVAVWVFVATYR